MYENRVKVFIGLSLAVLLVCVLRLVQLQVCTSPALQQEIVQATELHGPTKQLKTLRGKILDRRGEVLAADMPQFQICISYRLACYLDDRVVLAMLAAAKMRSANPSMYEVHKDVDDKRQDLARIIEKCTRFGATAEQIEATLAAGNDRVWNLRTFLCWRRGTPSSTVLAQYNNQIESVPPAVALAELEQQYPDPAVRYQHIARVQDIAEMNKDIPLLELKTEDDVFAAQLEFLEFLETDEVEILPTGHRYYPYRTAAAQTIGWVGPATQTRDTEAFADDPLASYLHGEVCGREDGVEYVCESLLRGRRGEVAYNSDGVLLHRTETEFGQDVQLTLDIDLQKRIEQRMLDPQLNPDYYKAPMAAALIDVRSGDILALLSLPSYDLNTIRRDYNKVRVDPNWPAVNRALFRTYPPGSVAKPLILIAGLESGAIAPDDTISCPAAAPPTGWPQCLIWRKSRSGHDLLWRNNARNATKGSCNNYFAHLADRLDSRVLQEWLFRFGFGREIPLACPEPVSPGSAPRHLREWPGEIGSRPVSAATDTEVLDQIPPLEERDRKMFGIGQGNFRVTPLQVANAYATLARRGHACMPRLFLNPAAPEAEPVDLKISSLTLQTVYEGMYAVVNEHGGTAYSAFEKSTLPQHGVKVYGKTGSTERPDHAWFAGFAEDQEGPKLALAVVVEGGQHGGTDAGSLAREILQLCVDAGYLGRRTPMK